MNEPMFAWDVLGRFKREGRFLEGYPKDVRTFFSPRDDVRGMLKTLLSSATHSLVLSMYGYADEELDEIVRGKLRDEGVYVQMSLDKTQAAGKAAKEILAKWHNEGLGNSIAIGTSVRGAISHLKICLVDGIYAIRGSTNWSESGQTKQDNELTLTRDPVIVAETRTILDIIHDHMLKQMRKSGDQNGNA